MAEAEARFAEFLLKIPEILSVENWIETRGQIVDGLFVWLFSTGDVVSCIFKLSASLPYAAISTATFALKMSKSVSPLEIRNRIMGRLPDEKKKVLLPSLGLGSGVARDFNRPSFNCLFQCRNRDVHGQKNWSKWPTIFSHCHCWNKCSFCFCEVLL